MSTIRKLSIAAAALVLLAAGCAEEDADTDAQQQSVEIEAFDNYYETETLLVEPGAVVTLTFQNGGGVAHSVTIPDLDFEVEAQSGNSVDSTFTAPSRPGSLDFYCKFHPDEMEGVISIGGADQPLEEDVDVDDDDDDVDVEVEVDEDEDTTP